MHLIHLSEEVLTRVEAGHESLPRLVPDGAAVAIGSFDGLHLGHRTLIDAVRTARDDADLAAAVLFTFRGHPRQVLDGNGPRLLTSWPEKLALIQDADIDLVVVVDFCRALAAVPYDDFVKRYLVEMLGMTHLVGGHDVHLGSDRGGDAATLAALGEDLGYRFEAVSALCLPDGRVVSSSAVRAALERGDVADAAIMLDRPYALWGEVVHGDGRGEGLGFPTANVASQDPAKLLPAPGVYAVRVHVPRDAVSDADEAAALGLHEGVLPEMDGGGGLRGILDTERVVFRGMLNHGSAPTVHPGGLAAPRLEVHILDFTGYIRDRSLKIEWVARLRDERTFASTDELVAQLRRDEAAVRDCVS